MKSLESLERYAEVQFSQITRLQEQVKRLQEENTQLKELLRTATPMNKAEVQDALSTEEEIAEREIRKLNELSQKEALTFEESKKLLNYIAILQARRMNDKGNNKTNGLSDAELMAKLNE